MIPRLSQCMLRSSHLASCACSSSLSIEGSGLTVISLDFCSVWKSRSRSSVISSRVASHIPALAAMKRRAISPPKMYSGHQYQRVKLVGCDTGGTLPTDSGSRTTLVTVGKSTPCEPARGYEYIRSSSPLAHTEPVSKGLPSPTVTGGMVHYQMGRVNRRHG